MNATEQQGRPPQLLETEPALSEGDLTHAVGDWLLTFGTDPARLPTRQTGSPWSVAVRNGDATLWQTEVREGWAGLPLRQIARGSWRAWLYGELFGGQSAGDTPAGVLEGIMSADVLNGHYLLLALDQTSGDWHVWTNRLATLHGYMASGSDGAAIGTFAPSVAAASGRTDLDWEGLATFFGFGFFAGDRTHFADVRILRPATHYRFDSRGRLLGEEQTWTWHHMPDMSRTYDQSVDEFASLLEEVMADMTTGGRIAIPISGGLDSRSTVAALPAGGDKQHLWSYSYGYSDDSAETAIARRIAARRGLPFHAYTIGPYLFGSLTQITAAVEGFEDVTQCRQAAVADALGRQADRVIAAHWGDVWLDDMGLMAYGAEPIGNDDFLDIVSHKFVKRGSDWLLSHLCLPHLISTTPDTIYRSILSAELAPIAAVADQDFRLKALKTNQWSARWTTTALRAYGMAAFPRLPFYDNRMVDFFCTVPTEMVSGRRLQIDYLRRHAPDLAKITWQATGSDLFDVGRSGFRKQAARVASRGMRLLSNKPLIERNWEIQFAGDQGQQGLSEWLLAPGLLLHDFVEPQDIRDLLVAFGHDPYRDTRSYSVAMLLSFSAWLETHYRSVIGQS